MNNEPVAWMELYFGEPNNLSWTDAELRNSGEVYKTIPLYTHPVKELNEEFKKGFNAGKEEGWKAHKFHHPAELTDAEILSLTGFKDNPYDIFIEYEKEDLIEFARAILRKAQEK